MLRPALPLLALIPFPFGCASALRYPGPLDSLADYVAAPAPATAAEATDTVAEETLMIGEGALPARRRTIPRGAGETAQQVVAASVGFLDQTRMEVGGEVYRHDCIGMVEAAYESVTPLELTSSIRELYLQAQVLGIAHSNPLPHPGDVAFFDHTYDKNRNGRRDDPFTHVTLVESVEEDGTIVMVHLGGRGKPVTRKTMNLLHPDETRSPEGKVWNEGLRAPSDRDGGPDLASQLFVGFGSFWAVSPDALADAARAVRALEAN